MLLSIVLIVVPLLVIFSNFKLLTEIPFAAWTWAQYGVALLSVALAVICVWNVFRAKKQWKVQKAKLADAYAAENQKIHEKRRALKLDANSAIEALPEAQAESGEEKPEAADEKTAAVQAESGEEKPEAADEKTAAAQAESGEEKPE
ncbi:MAG: hypothetical protein RSC58_01360 [Ruthenibacterium sp.]